MSETRRYIELIEKNGFCRIPNVYSVEQVKRSLDLINHWYEETVNAHSDRMPFLNKNQPMVYNLQSKDPFFVDIMFSSELMHSILRHFLNDSWFKPVDPNYILRSYLGRSSAHQMPLHIDAFIPYSGDFLTIMQCAMVVEDQNEANGCTVVVPGSHRAARYATHEDRSDAVPIKAHAGDLVIWDSRLWHGATANTSGQTRWSLIATFSRWWVKQGFDIPGNVPQEIYDGMTDRQKAVLGFCSVPYPDETVGIDMKRGYDLLPEKVEDYRAGRSTKPQPARR